MYFFLEIKQNLSAIQSHDVWVAGQRELSTVAPAFWQV